MDTGVTAETVIHPSAVVETGARIGAGAKIGPFCLVGPEVELGEGCELFSHVVVTGRTTIGPRARIYPFASIGHAPQDLKFAGEPSTLEIGADCTIREGVTMNPGTAGGAMRTVVGDRCLFLANSHVAHDCSVGNNVVFSNNVMLAGHCTIQDFVILGGGASPAIRFTTSGAPTVSCLPTRAPCRSGSTTWRPSSRPIRSCRRSSTS